MYWIFTTFLAMGLRSVLIAFDIRAHLSVIDVRYRI
jgi:hypothetical protein